MKKLFSIFMLFAVIFIFSPSIVASDSGPPADIGEELLLEHNSFTGMLDNNEIDIGTPMVIVCYPEMYYGTIRVDKCFRCTNNRVYSRAVLTWIG